MLVWTMRSVRTEPHILITDTVNEQWQIVKNDTIRNEIKRDTNQLIQESVIWNFVQQWFSISGDHGENAALWNMSCNRNKDCDTSAASGTCKIFCATNETLFSKFTSQVLPTYEYNEKNGIYWTPNTENIRIKLIDTANTSSTWQVQMTVSTSEHEVMDILAYVTLARNLKTYPRTMGYYITDFNSYRLN